MKNFNYFNPVKIHFGINYLEKLEELNLEEVLIISSKGFSKRGIIKNVEKIMGNKIIEIIDSITPNPQLDFLLNLKNKIRNFKNIIAIGGGSVIDSAKFLSVDKIQISKSDDLVVENNSSFKPIFAFPTTSGTSSELTKWATIWDRNNLIKYSLSHENLYSKCAFYDPYLMLTMPKNLTIESSLDALSHAFESIWNKNKNPISLNYALNAIKLIIDNLPKVVENLDSINLRTKIILSSIYAGLAFSNTQTAIAHAISYPLTMKFGIPHGIACSFSLPIILECIEDNDEEKFLLDYRSKVYELFKKMEISINPKDYNLDAKLINEIFNSLNSRAKNSTLDSNKIKNKLLKNLN